MIHAKKLVIPAEDDQVEEVQEQLIETKDTRIQHLIKLLIMALLTYVIIFM